MGRREKTKQARAEARKAAGKPEGRSKYAQKGKFAPPSTSKVWPSPLPTRRNGTVPATAVATKPKPKPSGVVRVRATVSEIHLDRGFIFLQSKEYPKIYLSDGTLDRYSRDILVTNGDIVDCDITTEAGRYRVQRIIGIRQLA